MFEHVDLNLPPIKRETIDGVRYYSVPDEDELIKLVSITSITSHYNKQIFLDWRKRVGNEEADRITKAATTRGTDMHTLTEYYLKNEELPKVPPISDFLFKISKGKLNKISKIRTLEGALYSKQLGIAGTVDCIAEYNNELAIIDFKTSKKPKPREWIEHYFVQAMAYGCMLYEMKGISVKKLVIIMACENGECVVYEEYDKSKYIKLLGEYIRKFVGDKLELYGTNKELEKAIANKFVTPQKFAMDIEKIVVDEELNYIDAIIHYCEINNIEVESVTKLISKPLKERLKWDAIRLNFMKKTSRAKLPL